MATEEEQRIHREWYQRLQPTQGEVWLTQLFGWELFAPRADIEPLTEEDVASLDTCIRKLRTTLIEYRTSGADRKVNIYQRACYRLGEMLMLKYVWTDRLVRKSVGRR